MVNCGSAGSHHCEVCEKERQFNLILQYRYWGVYWIFNFITEKHYSCYVIYVAECWELNNEEVESDLGESSYSFYATLWMPFH